MTNGLQTLAALHALDLPDWLNDMIRIAVFVLAVFLAGAYIDALTRDWKQQPPWLRASVVGLLLFCARTVVVQLSNWNAEVTVEGAMATLAILLWLLVAWFRYQRSVIAARLD